MSDRTVVEQEHFEYTPEEAALVMRLKIFSRMRWFFIFGIVIVTLVASRIFHIGFPALPVYIICIIMASYNLMLVFQARHLDTLRPGLVVPRARVLGNIHIALDLVMLAALLHFTGGIENPGVFFFVFHIVAASIALPYRQVYFLATSVILMITLLVALEYTGTIPHNHLAGFASPTLYKEVGYILAVMIALATILYATAYMSTAVSGELRKRQRQVVQLRESLLRERTGQLEQASREIAKLEEEKNQFLRFLSIAAHDLKAPLTAIQSYLWVMLGGYSGTLTDKQRNMMERSSQRITELLTLISDLLDIPGIEVGQIVQEMKEVSLSEIVKGCIDDLINKANEKGIEVNVELPQDLPTITGSGPRLRQVITNLLDNAITYTPDGEVTIRASERNDDLWVEVTDTGIGIPSQDLPQLFVDFFRGSNVDVKGTGLGLSISKRIVQAHGGRIWAESPCSETNKGSKFTFTLPKKCAAG